MAKRTLPELVETRDAWRHQLKPAERGRWLRSMLGRSYRPRDFLKPGKVLGVLSCSGRLDKRGRWGEEGRRESEKAHKSLEG